MTLTRSVWRFRLVATCLALTALAFVQSPGETAADTKLDLTQNPGGFLLRSLHLWDSQAFFGQLQNQAYGYLFPVGPFFWLGHLVGAPEWAIQRLWWSVLLCTAFLGAVRLGRLLGLSPLSRFVAGLAFALSPRMLSTLGPVSVESLPYALAPWVLVPLVPLRDGGSVRRAVTRSAVAVLLMGGINAVATGIAALVGAVWIVLEAHPTLRWRALTAWAGAVALATAWILGPLLLLGRYSPPFLDWIESASVTTSITDASASLRGVTDWVAYIAERGGPEWPAGWALLSGRVAVAGTAALAVLGVVGVVGWRRRHRRFLAACVLVGFVLITSPHVVDGAPWATGLLAEPLRHLLDGVLAPLRNVHKADVWIRLPFALGVGFVVGRMVALARRAPALAPATRRRTVAAGVVLAAVAALVASTSPALTGGLTQGRTFSSVPGYWQAAAAWLDTHAARTRALVLPGSSFGTYLWGQSRDEPLQPYADSPWAVRDAVPLSSAGNIRMLDAVEAVLDDGRGDAQLSEYLARAGVGFLVVRNDLDPGRSDAPRPSLVHQALTLSQGFHRVASFGPTLGGYATDTTVADGAVDGSYPAVEIFRVDRAAGDQRVALADARSVVALQGDPEALLGTASLDSGAAAVRTADLVPALRPVATLVTDAGRRTEVDFGRVHDNRSRTLTDDEPWTRARAVHDYVVSPVETHPRLVFDGISAVTSSSSLGDADSITLDPASGPWAAIDGSPLTAWFPRATDRQPWWRIDVGHPTSVGGGSIALAWPFRAGHATLVLTTARGTSTVAVTSQQSAVVLPESLGRSSWLRLSLLADAGVVGITEVRLPGVVPERILVAPGRGDEVSLRLRPGTRSPCVLGSPTNCLPGLWRRSEDGTSIDRVVSTSTMADAMTITVQPTLNDSAGLFAQPLRPHATAVASSSYTSSVQQAPRSAIDHDMSTAWVASPDDRRPTLTIALPHRERVSWLRFDVAPGLGASSPFDVTVSVGGRTFPLVTDSAGFVRFPLTATDRITIVFNASRPLLSLDTATTARTVLPVGVSEVELGEADLARVPTPLGLTTRTACGEGPDLEIDGRRIPTRVTIPVSALVDGGFGTATPCGDVSVPSGTHHVVVTASAAFAPVGLQWGTPPARSPGPSAQDGSFTVASWTSTWREVALTAEDHDRLLILAENANAGWTATLDGSTLEPVRVDGWRQAFLVPAGRGGAVVIRFAPDDQFRVALVLGAVLAALLVVLALLPVRRMPPPLPATAAFARARGVWFVAAVVAAVVSGPVAAVAAAIAAVVVRGRPRRQIAVAAAGAVLATVPAIVVTWPASASLAGWGARLGAVAVALGAGLVLAMMVSACWLRRGAPTAEPDARRGDR